MGAKSLQSFLIISFLIIFTHFASGQLKNAVTENTLWYPGMVVLPDGQQVQGKINYNFITGIVRLQNSRSTEVFTADDVVYFLIQKDQGAEPTKFYSLPIKPEGESSAKQFLFEVIYETETIALLSRHYYKYMAGTESRTHFQSEMETVAEALYLASANSKIAEYATIIKDFTYSKLSKKVPAGYEESKTVKDEGLKYKLSGKKTLPEMTAPYYEKIKAYMKAEKIKGNTINEIRMILDYYENLKK